MVPLSRPISLPHPHQSQPFCFYFPTQVPGHFQSRLEKAFYLGNTELSNSGKRAPQLSDFYVQHPLWCSPLMSLLLIRVEGNRKHPRGSVERVWRAGVGCCRAPSSKTGRAEEECGGAGTLLYQELRPRSWLWSRLEERAVGSTLCMGPTCAWRGPIDRARPTWAANKREEAGPQGGRGRAGAKTCRSVPGAR